MYIYSNLMIWQILCFAWVNSVVIVGNAENNNTSQQSHQHHVHGMFRCLQLISRYIDYDVWDTLFELPLDGSICTTGTQLSRFSHPRHP